MPKNTNALKYKVQPGLRITNHDLDESDIILNQHLKEIIKYYNKCTFRFYNIRIRNYLSIKRKQLRHFYSFIIKSSIFKPNKIFTFLSKSNIIPTNKNVDLKINSRWIGFFLNKPQNRNILIIDHKIPTPHHDSGSHRMYLFIKILRELNLHVTFIDDNLPLHEPNSTDLEQMGVEIIYSPKIKSIQEYLRNNGDYFNTVILSKSHIAVKHLIDVKKYCHNAKIVFDSVDLQFLRQKREAILKNNEELLKMSNLYKQIEVQLLKHCDATFVVSTYEKEVLLNKKKNANISLAPNIHLLRPPKNNFNNRKDLLFLGNFMHPPNIDAVKYFITDIFGIITKDLPHITLNIIGHNATTEIKKLETNNIKFIGHVNDLTTYFESSKLSIAPLRFGAGIKGKIGESMAHGLPVVTTTVGAEGMNLTHWENILIADEPKKFAKCVLDVYTNEHLWQVLSNNSINHIHKYFSYETNKNNIKNIMDNILK